MIKFIKLNIIEIILTILNEKSIDWFIKQIFAINNVNADN